MALQRTRSVRTFPKPCQGGLVLDATRCYRRRRSPQKAGRLACNHDSKTKILRPGYLARFPLERPTKEHLLKDDVQTRSPRMTLLVSPDYKPKALSPERKAKLMSALMAIPTPEGRREALRVGLALARASRRNKSGFRLINGGIRPKGDSVDIG